VRRSQCCRLLQDARAAQACPYTVPLITVLTC
jgi:hypothetical protein